MSRVLCINPGSTSTKIAVFDDEAEVCAVTVRHPADELAAFGCIAQQASLRRDLILDALAQAGIGLDTLDAVVGRGGLIRPVAGGTYLVDADLLDELRHPTGEHASNLGGILAVELAAAAHAAPRPNGPVPEPVAGAHGASTSSASGEITSMGRDGGQVQAFIVDPVVVDEFEPLARYSGHPEIERRSIFHALNQKAVARHDASDKGRRYEDLNLIVAHLGGGISVGAHRRGRVIDVNNALDGDGPFAPERAGGLPTASWAKLVLSGRYTPAETKRLLAGRGGLASLLGTSDAREADARATAGDEQARLALDAMAYQVAKEIGSAAAVLAGDVDAIVLTGGLAHDHAFVAAITARVSFIADVVTYPGEDEMPALRDGAIRVLRGLEPAKLFAEGVLHR